NAATFPTRRKHRPRMPRRHEYSSAFIPDCRESLLKGTQFLSSYAKNKISNTFSIISSSQANSQQNHPTIDRNIEAVAFIAPPGAAGERSSLFARFSERKAIKRDHHPRH